MILSKVLQFNSEYTVLAYLVGVPHAWAQWRTQWVAWIGPGLPTNLAQNSITTLEKLAQMLSFVSA